MRNIKNKSRNINRLNIDLLESVLPGTVRALAWTASIPRRALDYFDELEDPRGGHALKYPLRSILLLVLAAVASGVRTIHEVAAFGKEPGKKAVWREFAYLPTTMPSHDTLGRTLKLLKPARFGLVGIEPAATDTIAVDGKASRGSKAPSAQRERGKP